MNELLPFDSDLHEDLFKLMILASNDYDVYAIESVWWMDIVQGKYHFQFNDRSIAPVEFEGWVTSYWSGDGIGTFRPVDRYNERLKIINIGSPKKFNFTFEE